MADRLKQGRQLKTVTATFDVLSEIEQANGITLAELADTHESSKSTIYNHLKTLEQLGYVVQEQGEYYLGLGFISFGMQALDRLDLPNMVEPEATELVEETGGRCVIMVEENGRGICVYQQTSDEAVITNKNSGDEINFHCTALGKAYLSALPPKRRREFIQEKELIPMNENTIIDEDELFRELKNTRSRGYSINDEERVLGMRAVGAPIITKDEELLGAISVSLPVTRMKGERFEHEIPELVQKAASVIAVKKSYE